jgi:hypothetical protein
MTKKKRYQVTTACPQCGCSFATHLSEEELRNAMVMCPMWKWNAVNACCITPLPWKKFARNGIRSAS